ncbi:hypothetical protein HKCCE4037_05315 [Rhodobacterales bacterium HKCCE4037]|mgnify:CR=1 FL=1|nr:hypothetical protein [Rhodobacterales bacterium HKCCE4037]
MARFKGFVRVASSYDLMDIRMAVAALEGADIMAITPGVELGNTMPYASLALGAMEIHVPEAQADEAAALLNAIAAGTVIPHDQRDLIDDDPAPLQRETTIGDKLRNLFGFLVGGVSQPLKGVLVEKRRRDDD